MSYILEALKKADAERERGAVPSLHAQPVPLAAAYEDPAAHRPKPWLWLATGSAIALVAVLAWRFSGNEAPPAAVAVPPPAPTPGLAAPSAAPVTPVAPPAPLTQSQPEAAPVLTPRPAPPRAPREAAASAPAPAPKRARAEPRPSAIAASAVAAAGSGPASSVVAKVAKAAPTAPSATRAPSLAELPEDIRRQVPAMTIGGSVYSQQPANRMVIINGQVFREGSAVTPDLLLEQIGPKAAVFSLRGQRFEMPF